MQVGSHGSERDEAKGRHHQGTCGERKIFGSDVSAKKGDLPRKLGQNRPLGGCEVQERCQDDRKIDLAPFFYLNHVIVGFFALV